MIALDTNVLVRHFLEDDQQQTIAARRVLAGLSPANPGFLCLTVLVELFWVLARTQRMPVADVLRIFEGLMESEELEIEDGESFGEALEAARRGADFPDALIRATSRLYGITETVTFDRHAAETLGWRLLS